MFYIQLELDFFHCFLPVCELITIRSTQDPNSPKWFYQNMFKRGQKLIYIIFLWIQSDRQKEIEKNTFWKCGRKLNKSELVYTCPYVIFLFQNQ